MIENGFDELDAAAYCQVDEQPGYDIAKDITMVDRQHNTNIGEDEQDDKAQGQIPCRLVIAITHALTFPATYQPTKDNPAA